ncbi:YceI family protein [Aquimarina agarilytica]|uniref:YceI family protein n=1 Tax=Aquimarina agarilytica TaxID=1087449 RepID=UPI0002894207|nr:YceI family protein [Aquimarina agarilytica]
MKKQLINILAVTVLTASFISCKKNKEVETTNAKTVEQVVTAEKFKAVPAQTMIKWNAHKIVGGHQGTINASAGLIEVKGNDLVGGNFIFDINTIKCSDLPAGENYDKLIGHLKNEDFFDVAKHPSAAFQITSVTPKNGKSVIAGNLSIKGIKKNIEFPATVSVNGNTVTITSDEFEIDRTEWGVKYNSGKFADPAKLGDYLIKDNVGIQIAVTASK